ncbi:hypothetical protein pb186bvf_018824 [Paramecium bursaria]
MSFHPFIKIINENDSFIEQNARDYENDLTLREKDNYLIILIAYWELFIQEINGSEYTPIEFNGQQLIFKKEQNQFFLNFEDKQLLEQEMVIQISNCLKSGEYWDIQPLKRDVLNSNIIVVTNINDIQNVKDTLDQNENFKQKNFIDAINIYYQWKNLQHQININQQNIQAYEYYINQFQVQKQFLEGAQQILKTSNLIPDLSGIIQNVLEQTSELQEPILKNYKIYWTQEEFKNYKPKLQNQIIYYVKEEQKQQLNDKLSELRCLQLQQGNVHDFTILYYKYNFIIKGLLNFERFIYFNDYDLHFKRIFKQFNTSKLNMNWVAQILQSNEIILF